MYCIHCGAQNADTNRFCLNCGQALAAPPISATRPQPAAPQPPPTSRAAGRAPSRRRWPIFLGAALVLCLIVAVGGYLLARQWLHLGTNEAAKLMPAKTSMMVSVSPNPLQLNQLQKLQAIAGAFGAMTQSQGALPSNLLNTPLDIDPQKDIVPWAGLEMAAGVTDLGRGDTGLVVAVAMRDSNGARKFTDKLLTQLEKDGRRFSKETYNSVEIVYQSSGSTSDQLAFAQVNGFLVAGAPPAAVRQAVDTAKGRSQALATDAIYQKAIKELAGKGIGYVYLDWAALERLGNTGASSVSPATRALQSIGATLNVEATGIRLDFIVLQDPARLSTAQLQALQAPANRNRVLSALPDNALFLLSGQKLQVGYDQLIELAQQVPGEGSIEDSVQEIEEELGISLKRDLFNWADGEYALAFHEDPAGLMGNQNTPFSFTVLLEAKDRRAAEQSMARIADNMIYMFHEEFTDETIAGVKFRTVTGSYGDTALGYGFVSDFMVIGGSRRALGAAADAGRSPLSKDAVFKAATAPLPTRNGGYAYVNIERFVDLIYRNMSSYEKQDFNRNVRPYIENVRAIAAASQPGGKDGVMRGSVFLLFTEGAFK